LKDYAGLQAEGAFALDGFAKGKLTEIETPSFELNLSIQNVMFNIQIYLSNQKLT
jgi:hypothetical protein